MFSNKILKLFILIVAISILIFPFTTWKISLPAKINAVKASSSHFIQVPFHYQIKGYYCGPAALQMVFDYYGANISQYEIADVARTVPYVTYTDDLRRAAHFSNLSTSMGNELVENITGYTARKLGYAAFEKGGLTIDDLKSLIDQDFPIILLMRWVPNEPYGHFRVAVGYNETHIFLHDPWNNIKWGGEYGGPNLPMNYTFFDEMWDYSGHWSLFVSPWKIKINTPHSVYVSQSFTVTANITYVCPAPFTSYDYPASSCKATILLPDGLTLLSDNATKNIDYLKGKETVNVSWTVRAEDLGNYTFTVEAEGEISGFVGEKSDVGLKSYSYKDRIGEYASNLITVEKPSKIYISWINPAEASPGSNVSVFGGGATPNGTVVALLYGPTFTEVNITLIIGEVNRTLGWTNADNYGKWNITFTVPPVNPGNYIVYVVDNETLTSDSTEFTVTARIIIAPPSFSILSLSPSMGPSGTIVSICIVGASGQVMVFFNGENVLNLTAFSSASACSYFQIPKVIPGNYTVTALDVNSNTTDTAIFTVTPPPKIYVSPQKGSIGSKITVRGESFNKESSFAVWLMFEDQLLSTIFISKNGEFNVTVFVPAVNSGNYTLKVIGTNPYGMTMLANATFTVTTGLDTLLQMINNVKNATQINFNKASSAEALVSEARNYALVAMIFAIITTVISVIILIKKGKR